MAKTVSIPPKVAEKSIQGIRAALRKMGRADLASSMGIEVKRGFVYVAEADGSPLCRLRYLGKPDVWGLQMFKWSTESYDTEGDFPFGGGSLADCIGQALEVYNL
ncbi:MAG: hypothetical protein HY721_01195 [Planctomycetes bacterium]|nr:hypothetical protein [Planctomycetota bacterium]